MAETFDCREAMALANALDLQNMTIASDNQGVVNDILVRTGGSHATIVDEIMERNTSFLSCSFVFARRNFNCEAHDLGMYA